MVILVRTAASVRAHRPSRSVSMYLLSYFRTDAEALHFALSTDGLRWQAVHHN